MTHHKIELFEILSLVTPLNTPLFILSFLLDRLIHHSYILNIQGESYRLKEKRKAGLLNIMVKN